MVEETAAASQVLAGEARQLQAQLARFKLEGGASARTAGYRAAA